MKPLVKNESRMSERLSSVITPVYKATPFVVAGYAYIRLILNPANASIGALLFIILWCGIFLLSTFRWKKVHLQVGALRISNYFRSITIPFSEIAEVQASHWFWGWQPRTIKITLRHPTSFGRTIIFVPGYAGYGAGETAEELRRLVSAWRKTGS
jgi:hypothetical protein